MIIQFHSFKLSSFNYVFIGENGAKYKSYTPFKGYITTQEKIIHFYFLLHFLYYTRWSELKHSVEVLRLDAWVFPGGFLHPGHLVLQYLIPGVYGHGDT